MRRKISQMNGNMITFIEDRCSNYQHRTFMNVELAEVTIIFAIDLTTAGEKCTLNYCRICEKPVFVFNINENGKIGYEQGKKLAELVNYIHDNKIKSVNIAGNGIYTFNKYGITQERLNELVYNFLTFINTSEWSIQQVRSGGQTGADEAGLVAGDRLGVETISLCPKGWRFRTADGKDMTDEKAYKERFNNGK